jgi:L-threonylcarbamoyladenylate synthase
MKSVKIEQDSPLAEDVLQETARILSRGGLVCLPCGGAYRVIAPLMDEAAVTRLMQSKRRTRKAPALIFIDSEERLKEVAAQVDPAALRLARRFWPGPLTLLFEAHPDLPAKVARQLVHGDGRLGVRIPGDAVAHAVVEALQAPVLVSSANREARAGAESPAQVRKNFMGRVDLLLDAGDLKPCKASTVVEVLGGGALQVIREGALDPQELQRVASRAA